MEEVIQLCALEDNPEVRMRACANVPSLVNLSFMQAVCPVNSSHLGLGAHTMLAEVSITKATVKHNNYNYF